MPAGLPTCARWGGGSAPGVGEPRQRLCQAPWVGATEKKKKPNLPSEGTRRGVAGHGVADWTTVCVGELCFRLGIPEAPLGGRHLARRLAGDGLPLRHVRRAMVHHFHQALSGCVGHTWYIVALNTIPVILASFTLPKPLHTLSVQWVRESIHTGNFSPL